MDDPYYARNDDIQNNKVVVVVDDIRILEIRTNNIRVHRIMQE